MHPLYISITRQLYSMSRFPLQSNKDKFLNYRSDVAKFAEQIVKP